MFPTTTIPNLHKEYSSWMRELIFYKEEIKLFERQLEDVASKQLSMNASAKVEQYQNQFIREKEVIDELKHKLNISERQLAGFVKNVSGLGLNSIRMDNHPGLRDEMNIFRKIYGQLKQSFRKFEAACK